MERDKVCDSYHLDLNCIQVKDLPHPPSLLHFRWNPELGGHYYHPSIQPASLLLSFPLSVVIITIPLALVSCSPRLPVLNNAAQRRPITISASGNQGRRRKIESQTEMHKVLQSLNLIEINFSHRLRAQYKTGGATMASTSKRNHRQGPGIFSPSASFTVFKSCTRLLRFLLLLMCNVDFLRLQINSRPTTV